MSKVTRSRESARAAEWDGRCDWLYFWRDFLTDARVNDVLPSVRCVLLGSWHLCDRRTGQARPPDGVPLVHYLARELHCSRSLIVRALAELQRVRLVRVEGETYTVLDFAGAGGRYSPAPGSWVPTGGRRRRPDDQVTREALRSRARREARSASSSPESVAIATSTAMAGNGQNMSGVGPVEPRSNPPVATVEPPRSQRSQSGRSAVEVRSKFAPETLTSSENPQKETRIEKPDPHAAPPVATVELPGRNGRTPVATVGRNGRNETEPSRSEAPLAPPSGGCARALISVPEIEAGKRILRELESASLGAISTRADRRTLVRFARVVRDLAEVGTTEEDWVLLGRYVAKGGTRWRTQGPIGVGYLGKSGVAARLIDEARSDAASRAKTVNGSAKPAGKPAGPGVTKAAWDAARANLAAAQGR